MLLTLDQLSAVEDTESHRCVFITGPAGTGKSVLIKHLVSVTFIHKKVHLCSSTGISAYNIGGITVHSFIIRIGLPRKHPLSISLTQDDIIIIDEISMLGKKTFDILSDTLQAYHRKSGNPFGGHKMIFVGDFAQLPPVDDCFAFQSKYWNCVEKTIELKEIKRQSHIPFVEFLLRVRSGELTTADRKKLMELSKKPACKEAVHLYPTNDRARQHNQLKLNKVSEESKSLVVSFPAKVVHTSTTDDDAEIFFKAQKARIYEKLELCVGARVMITSNLSVENGWMNGTIATVLQIEKDFLRLQRESDGAIEVILPEVYAMQKVVRCGKCTEIKCDHQTTTFYLYVSSEEVDRKFPYLRVSQYPLLLAWGMTIHKSQGLTLPGCVIHLYGRYPPSLFYVAISRCVSEEGVVIRTGDGIHFDQIVPEEMVMKRLFQRKEKECQVCGEIFIGPYKLCSDCCCCPDPYGWLPFTAFSKNLSKEKEDYVYQILEHQGQEARYKKFKRYLATIYKVFKQ